MIKTSNTSFYFFCTSPTLCIPLRPLSALLFNIQLKVNNLLCVYSLWEIPCAFIQLPGNIQLWMLGSCLQRRDSALRTAIAAIACMPNCPTLHLWLEVQLSLNWDISLKQMWDFEYGFKKLLRPEAGAVMRLHRRPIVFFNVESKKGNCKLQPKICNGFTHQITAPTCSLAALAKWLTSQSEHRKSKIYSVFTQEKYQSRSVSEATAKNAVSHLHLQHCIFYIQNIHQHPGAFAPKGDLNLCCNALTLTMTYYDYAQICETQSDRVPLNSASKDM